MGSMMKTNRFLDQAIRNLASDLLVDAALDAEDLLLLISRVLWSTVKVAEKLYEIRDKYGNEVFTAGCREAGLDERTVKALKIQSSRWKISPESREVVMREIAKKTLEVLNESGGSGRASGKKRYSAYR